MNEKRISEKAAGYMELVDAQKNGDCQLVEVDGGVSSDRGCCNLFEPENEATTEFRCGTCEYRVGQHTESESKPLTKESTRAMTLREILDSQRPVEGKR
jgi:hypothetical protein